MTTIALEAVPHQHTPTQPVPMSRIMQVELRKMFDTRSGFWLMASLAITALIATVATALFAPHDQLTYYTFAKATGLPMTIVLPMIAILAITGEWSQRSGLTTFTLVPQRQRVILAKGIASVAVAVASMLFALVVGVVGNLVGSTVVGIDPVWDVSLGHVLTIVLGNLLCLLTGTMLGLLFRSSPVALVAYFLFSLVLPTLSQMLAASQQWFRDLQPWMDLNHDQGGLFEGTITGQGWAQLAVAVVIWIVLPGLVGLRLAMRSEVS